MARKQKRTKAKPDPVVMLALSIVPAAQVRNGQFEKCDISNHAEEDQRRMVRSGERTTIRRKPKFIQLYERGILNHREAAACEWYSTAHSMRYDTVGITANYCGVGGRSTTNFDHAPKSREQEEALREWSDARSAIDPMLVGLFERVVLHGMPLKNLVLSFKLATGQLLSKIEGRVQL